MTSFSRALATPASFPAKSPGFTCLRDHIDLCIPPKARRAEKSRLRMTGNRRAKIQQPMSHSRCPVRPSGAATQQEFMIVRLIVAHPPSPIARATASR
jgi:hypothetical protein